MQIDFSKAAAIHRLYGHHSFIIEMVHAGKSKSFARQVCSSVKCTEKTVINTKYVDPPLNYRSAL